MVYPVNILQEGGPLIYLQLAMVLPICAAVLVAGLTAMLRRRVPLALWLALCLAPTVVGLWGTHWAAGLGLDFVPTASPDIVGRISATSISVALYTTIAGATLSTLAAFGFAAALALGGLLARKKGLEDPPELVRERTAALRLSVGVLLAVGLLSLLLQQVSFSYSTVYQALANARMELVDMLVARAYRGLWLEMAVLTLASLAALAGGVLSVGDRRAGLTSRRSIAHGILASLVLGGTLLATLAMPIRLVTLAELVEANPRSVEQEK